LGNSEHLALFEENAGNIEHRGNIAPQVSRKEGTLTRGYQAEIGPLIKAIQISMPVNMGSGNAGGMTGKTRRGRFKAVTG